MSIRIVPCLIYLLIFFSCKKDDSRPDSNTPPTTSDTLSAGWTKKVLPASIFDIFFINNTGFTIGSGGIFRSTDGGNNWIMVSSASNGVNIGMGSETNAAFVLPDQRIIFTQNGGA